ncbi:MAG: hypothetical protein ACOX4W_00825 [Bacilli bacterium]
MELKNNNKHGNKKIVLLLVLKALEQMSDESKPIKQIELVKMVNSIGRKLNLDIWCDRKTIGRHLEILKVAGYQIKIVKGKGCYLESNKFTKQESEKILQLIKGSQLTEEVKTQLENKLNAQQVNLKEKEFKKHFR